MFSAALHTFLPPLTLLGHTWLFPPVHDLLNGATIFLPPDYVGVLLQPGRPIFSAPVALPPAPAPELQHSSPLADSANFPLLLLYHAIFFSLFLSLSFFFTAVNRLIIAGNPLYHPSKICPQWPAELFLIK